MNRQELLSNIDNMIIYEKDYDTLSKLVKYCSPRLFTKIMEEVFLDNLYISDFDSVFPDDISDGISKEVVRQADIENRYYNLLALRQQIDSNSNFRNEIAISSNDANYSRELENAKKNLISELFEKSQNDDASLRQVKEILYEKLMSNPENFLFSRDDYLVPISFNDITLDSYDLEFQIKSGITEDEMKKIKALSLYLMKSGD